MQNRILLGLIGASLVPVQAKALGIRLPGQDAFAISRANAFVATADNPSAIYYNPSGITQLEGHQAYAEAYVITLNSDFTSPSGAEFSTEDAFKAVPQVYYTFAPKEKPWAAGIGLYAPFGLGNEWPDNTPFRQFSLEGRMQYLTVNPVFAWEFGEQFSIGAGPMFNFATAEIIRGILPAGFPPPGNRFRLEGDGASVGANVGILWQPHPQHSFGAVYRSPNKIDFEGETETTGFPTQDASAEFQFPQIITVGYSFRPTTDWNFEVNVDWTDWDSLNTVTVEQASGNLQLPFNWESSFLYQFGATRYFESGWAASAGYTFSENSVPEMEFNPGIPDSDRHVFSVGVTRQWENWDFGLAYQYAHGPSRTVNRPATPPAPGSPNEALVNGEYEFNSHALSLSAGYRF